MAHLAQPVPSAFRRRPFSITVALAMLTVCAAAALVGCQKKNQPVALPPPEVIVATPQQRDITEYVQSTGTAHPVMLVEIRARVRGFLKERHVAEGAFVKKDQLLLVVDEEPFQVALEQAKATLAGAEAALLKAQQSQAREMMQAQLAMDEAQLQLAATDEERLKPIIAAGTGAVSKAEMDRAVATRKQAEAKIAATRANLAQVDADFKTNILSGQAAVAEAKTQVRTADINLGYCRIYSPLAGRIGRVNFDVGNLVGDGQASLLTTIVEYDPIQVYTTLNVEDFNKFRASATQAAASSSHPPIPVELGVADEKGYPHHGRIDYTDPAVDQGTGTIEIRGVFANPDAGILPGMDCRLRIPVGTQQNALLVPETAIATDQVGQYVYIVDADNKVSYRHVEIGRSFDGLRVVQGKLGLQDRVIVEGLLRAKPGAVVNPKPQTAQAGAQPAAPQTRVSVAN